MQFLAYILIYPFLWLISILPFRLFYAFSDVVCFLVYRLFGYRKSIVRSNLKMAFPNKTDAEIKHIEKKFYSHMCDLFLEMIKSLSISKKQLNKRFVITNQEALTHLEGLNKSIILMYGHNASYEWSVVTENYVTHKGIGIYKALANKYFDALARRVRSKYNTELVDTKKAIALITDHEQKGIKTINAFLSDQSPRAHKAYYWTKFMGIYAPCFTGAEMLAKKLDFSVAYMKIDKVKRGFYEAEISILAENPKDYKDYDITEKFTRTLEAQIYEKPEFYLWTHKRWKHKDRV